MSGEYIACENCQFYRSQKDSGYDADSYGECHRYPPKPRSENAINRYKDEYKPNFTAWPVVESLDFCGEYKQCD